MSRTSLSINDMVASALKVKKEKIHVYKKDSHKIS
jgi:hypothetical protein